MDPRTNGLQAQRLRTNLLDSPLGIDDPTPEFSWHLQASHPSQRQGAYRVQVSGSGTDEPLWDSGRIDHPLPFGIRYDGPRLESAHAYSWRVQVWDHEDRSGGWSEAAGFETGMLDPDRWRADWVTAEGDHSHPIYLRGTLDLDSPVVRARAYASALGWYRLFVNGDDLTGSALVPRYTPYSEIVEYQVYDVTDVFKPGKNIVGMAIADGRFRGHQGFFDRRKVYGKRLAGFLQVELELLDGTTRTWTTDHRWAAGPGRITSSDPKLGERADLRIRDSDWIEQPDAPSRFTRAELLPPHSRRLVAEEVPRVKDVATFTPRVWRSPAGRQLVDLGQNIAGVLRLRLRGAAGTTVRLTFGEALTPEGEFDPHWIIQNPKKPWYQRDEVVLDGTDQWWQPWFTIHGFRYVEIEGLDHDLTADDVVGIALSSDLDDAGTFAASDDRLTRLWQNVYWSTRSNFTDTPTDCPTRERSGWTGDIQVFAPTATGMVDSQAFLRRYLRNVAIEQKPNGNVSPWVPSERSGEVGLIPRLVSDFLGNSVGWGDVAVLTPWDVYRFYGDRTVLERQYESMRRWVDRLARHARRRGPQRWFAHRVGRLEPYILDSGFHWGEWLRPGESFPSNFLDGTLHGAALATAYFERSTRTLADAAGVLGRRDDAARYRSLADTVREAWRAAFLRDGGRRIGRDLQDDYVRALAFGLLDADEKTHAANRLAELIQEADVHLATGFLSTPMLLTVLCENGHRELAFRLLFQDTAPSWLYQVERGATTIWETWEGHDETGRARESHNHYALGSVAGWMREKLLGVSPLEGGYRRIKVAPVVGGGLTWVAGSVATPFGDVTCRWETTPSGGTLNIGVPAGAEAQVHLPGVYRNVGSGEWAFTWESDS